MGLRDKVPNSHQHTKIHWKPAMTQLEVNPAWVDVEFLLGSLIGPVGRLVGRIVGDYYESKFIKSKG